MASSTTCSLFLLLALLACLHVHARDSQFFSKVTSNNIPKEVLPTKEQEPLSKPEQEPNFVPQNQQNSGGYGLFGHESGQLPPTTENLPYKTQTENPYNKESNPNLVDGLYYNNDANYLNKELYSNSNNGDQYYNNDAQVTKQQGMSETRLMDNAYTTPITNNNNGDRFYNINDAYVTKPQGMSNTRFTDKAYTTPIRNNNNGDRFYNNDAYVAKPQGMTNTRFMDNAYTTPITNTNNNFNDENMYNNNREHGIGDAKLGVTNGNNYNNEKPGMSDTRVMENGRYYYDLDSEKNYNLNNYNNNQNENSRGFNSRNEYENTRGNYGNSFKGRYGGNNENSYDANNFMEGYNGNQEEFQEIQDEQFNP